MIEVRGLVKSYGSFRALDGLEEARLKDKKYGSTLRGIAPVYSDKYQKKWKNASRWFIMQSLVKSPSGVISLLKAIRRW